MHSVSLSVVNPNSYQAAYFTVGKEDERGMQMT